MDCPSASCRCTPLTCFSYSWLDQRAACGRPKTLGQARPHSDTSGQSRTTERASSIVSSIRARLSACMFPSWVRPSFRMYGAASIARPFVAAGSLHSFRIRSSWLELHAPRLPIVAVGLRDQARPTVPRLSQPLPSSHGPRPGGSDARVLGSGAHGHGCGMDRGSQHELRPSTSACFGPPPGVSSRPLRRVCTDGRTASTGWKLGFDLGLKRGRSGLIPGRKGRKRKIGSRMGGRGRATDCGCQPREHRTCAWTHRRTPTSSIGWTCSSECRRRAARIVDASKIGTGCVHGRDSNRG